MGPRVYPSEQKTNINADGSLILSVDNFIEYVDVYVNGVYKNIIYSDVNGLYSIPLQLNDVVRIEYAPFFSLRLNRRDYTTDDVNGNIGIEDTVITPFISVNSYTFTASTLSDSYNFEYRGFISFPGPTPTPTPSPTPTVTPTPTPSPTPIAAYVNWYYNWEQSVTGSSIAGYGIYSRTDNADFISAYSPMTTTGLTGTFSGLTYITNNLGVTWVDSLIRANFIDTVNNTYIQPQRLIWQLHYYGYKNGVLFFEYGPYTSDFTALLPYEGIGYGNGINFTPNVGDLYEIYWDTKIETQPNVYNCLLQFTDANNILFVGGFIQSFNNNLNYKCLISIFQNGCVNTSFTGYTTTTIRWLQKTSDNKLLVSGEFPGGVGLKRYTTEGLLDPSFALFYSEGCVNVIEMISGDYIISGLYIRKITNNATFLISSDYIDCRFLGRQSNGNIIAVGRFGSYTLSGVTTSANSIIALKETDLTPATGYTFGTGFVLGTNEYVYMVKIDNNDRIVCCGSFKNYNGTSKNGLVYLNSDGSIYTGFTMGTGFNGNVYVVEILSNGQLLVGGDFTSYNGTSVNQLVRLNSNGTLDNTLNTGTGFSMLNIYPGNTPYVKAIQVLSNGNIMVGGKFQKYKGSVIQENGFIIINSTGTLQPFTYTSCPPTPTPLPTFTPTPTVTPTPTPTSTPTPTPTPTPVPYEGQYMLAVKSDNLVYKSNDFGTTWTQVSGFTTGMTVTDTAISQTGQYQIISTYNGPLYVSNNYGVSFTSVGTNDTYTDVALSSNGQYMCAITDAPLASRKLVRSLNYGVSFFNVYSPIGQTASDLAMDDDGNAYISWRNGVQKFIRSTGSMIQLYNNTLQINWSSVTVSGNGLYVATTRNSVVQYSTNGSTFTSANSLNTGIVTVVSSRDGRYLQTYGSSNTKSSNSGVSWSSSTGYGNPAISQTGQYQGVAVFDDIKISTDYGLTYNTVFSIVNAYWKNLSINR